MQWWQHHQSIFWSRVTRTRAARRSGRGQLDVLGFEPRSAPQLFGRAHCIAPRLKNLGWYRRSELYAIADLIQCGEDTPDVLQEQAPHAGQLGAAGDANERTGTELFLRFLDRAG